MRASGILMPVFSLPGPYGIGTLGREAYRFVDFLSQAKQTFWQILPIGPTGYGDSPYQSFPPLQGIPISSTSACWPGRDIWRNPNCPRPSRWSPSSTASCTSSAR